MIFGLYARLAAAAVVATLLAGAGWKIYQSGYNQANSEWVVKVAAQKIEAAKMLADETAKVATAEKSLRDFKDKQELRDGKNRTKVVGLERRLRAAATANAGRLRDPHGERCGPSSPAAPSPVTADPVDSPRDVAEGAGALSKPLTELLFELTREADEVNLAYASCRADAMSIREATK